ncbi:MAG: Holliday junction resolvase RuvX [bacterium]|nr:Holliday junction resolvase RuvX [bacterium]
MRIIGLDIGDVRIGVAMSDESGIIAQGIDVLTRENDSVVFKQLKNLIDTYQAKEIVVGLPKKMNGEVGHQANKTLEFIETMRLNVNIPIKTWDERFTSKIAKNVLKQTSVKTKRQKGNVDKLAAILILQGYLDCCQKNSKRCSVISNKRIIAYSLPTT